VSALKVPAQGCPTCPYLRATPPGIWDASEYEKLAEYDEQPGQLPVLAAFHCHQENATGQATVCRGWLSVHRGAVAVRLACARGALQASQVQALPEEPQYYATGAEAAAAGLAGVEYPGDDARKKIAGLVRRGVAR